MAEYNMLDEANEIVGDEGATVKGSYKYTLFGKGTLNMSVSNCGNFDNPDEFADAIRNADEVKLSQKVAVSNERGEVKGKRANVNAWDGKKAALYVERTLLGKTKDDGDDGAPQDNRIKNGTVIAGK